MMILSELQTIRGVLTNKATDSQSYKSKIKCPKGSVLVNSSAIKHQKSLSQSQTQFTEQQKNIKKSGSKQTLSHMILTSLKQDLHSQKLS